MCWLVVNGVSWPCLRLLCCSLFFPTSQSVVHDEIMFVLKSCICICNSTKHSALAMH
jgi:hypothetical protein